LDPTQIRETRKLIRELGQDHTILLSTHILSEVEKTCQRVIIVNRGEVALDRILTNNDVSGRLEEMFVQITGAE
jgi:ABC-2 type transport system ATP-binding protein